MHPCHSEETAEGLLLVHTGEINPVTGVTDDSRMETRTIKQKEIFMEFHRMNIHPVYWINSRTEIRSRLINSLTHSQFPDVVENILPVYHAYEIFHLVDENQMFPDMYVSIERQQIGIIMQISSIRDVVLKKLKGYERQGQITEMAVKSVENFTFDQLIEIFAREKYLKTRYSLFSNNCQMFIKNLNHVIDSVINEESV